MRELECTLEDVEKVVKDSDKQRFEMQVIDGVHHIRAVQGHSIEAVEDEASLTRLSAEDATLPERCVHGTYRRHLRSIMQDGLKPGGKDGAVFRKHVHFTPFEPGDKKVISGFRYDVEVAIWIDLKRAMEAGIPFYISPNKVILSPGKDEAIPSEFINKVTNVKGGEEIPLDTDWTKFA
jgi:2'-phosphotransferase